MDWVRGYRAGSSTVTATDCITVPASFLRAKFISISLSIMPRPVQLESVRYVSSTHVKFRRDGATCDGISLSEAMAGVRLTEDGSHTPTDLNVRDGGTIVLKIKASVFQSIYILFRRLLIPTAVVRV